MNNRPPALINLSSGNHTVLFIVLGFIVIAFIVRNFVIKPSSPLGQQLRAQDKWPVGIGSLLNSIGSALGFVGATCFFVYGYIKAAFDSFVLTMFAGLAVVCLISAVSSWIGYRLWKRK